MPQTKRRTKGRDALTKLYGKGQDRYLALLAAFPLRPIRTEDDLDAATGVIHALVDQEKLTAAEQDYLAVLTDLVEAYEQVHYPDEPVSDAAMLRYMIDLKETTQTAVAKGAGVAESTISEVLSGKRKLTRAQVGKLARFFRVEPGVFAD